MTANVIPGLDTRLGLKRVMGKKAFYLDKESDSLFGILGTGRLGPFEHAIKQYDFEKAMELMRPQAERFNKQQ
jgi:hypothetical protein